METVGSAKHPKARKKHRCNGREQLDRFIELTDDYQCKGVIDIGQTHLKYFVVDGGDCWNYRTCYACDDLVKLNECYDY